MTELSTHGSNEINTDYPPLLVFNIGMLGCLPLGFSKEFADTFGMAHLSEDEIRWEIIKENDKSMDSKRAQNVHKNQLRNQLISLAEPLLTSDNDVTLDTYRNSPKDRLPFIRLAKNTGALTLGLLVNTPRELCLKRVSQWQASDSFITPVERWSIPPLDIAKSTSPIPKLSDGLDINYILGIDGSTDLDGVIEQCEELFESNGLAERFEYH